VQKAFDPYMALLDKEYAAKADRDKTYYEILKDIF
jgi:hypothetical protein